MSLKAFHLAFVTACTGLAGFVGYWAVGTGHTAWGVVAFTAMVACPGYGWWFLRKMKDVSFL